MLTEPGTTPVAADRRNKTSNPVPEMGRMCHTHKFPILHADLWEVSKNWLRALTISWKNLNLDNQEYLIHITWKLCS